VKVVVTGGAGFIGSNVADHLAAAGHQVTVIDNFSTGQRRFLDGFTGEVIELDLVREPDRLPEVVEGHDAIVHLAANADVRFGWADTRRDLEQNVVATLNVADAMRATGVRRFVFSSTGSVYGEATQIPTPETSEFPDQTSLYGASKAAAEGYLAAFAEAGFLDVTVFRFVSILGPRYTHGHVKDFVRQLREHPDRLEILGDGKQRKGYLHVSDCVAAIAAQLPEQPRFEVFNLGLDESCVVDESAAWIAQRLGVDPIFEHTGGDRGWIGDNPVIVLDAAKIRRTGWSPRFTIREAVEDTVDFLVEHPWVLGLSEAR
jgi:UDP-glucose 4-epimerase